LDKGNKIIILLSLFAVMSFLITYLVSVLLQPPTIEDILTLSKQRMNSVRDINITYRVDFLAKINGTIYNETGFGSYYKDGGVASWINDITMLGNSLFNIKPERLIEILELNQAGEYIRHYQSLVNCYKVSGLIITTLSENINTLLGGYDYIKIDACFNQSNGYPISYAMLITSDLNGGMISYTSTGDITWA